MDPLLSALAQLVLCVALVLFALHWAANTTGIAKNAVRKLTNSIVKGALIVFGCLLAMKYLGSLVR